MAYINETVTNQEHHHKFLTPDGLIRLLVARDYVVEKTLEMFKKWVVSIHPLSVTLIRIGDWTSK